MKVTLKEDELWIKNDKFMGEKKTEKNPTFLALGINKTL